jgi:uncharacterized protein (TIGR02145 family)
MNKFFALISASLLSLNMIAQAPQKMSYQVVIRNSSDALVANQQVGMRVSILKDSENGTSVYSETHNVNTNQNGLVSIAIGGGNVLSGDFSKINWGSGIYFVKTETDIKGGTNYSISGTSQMLSVPYALYALNSQPGPKGDKGDQGVPGKIQNMKVSLFGDTLYYSDDKFIIIPDISSSNNIFKGDLITDVDGNAYKTVTIGSQTWMAENLKTTKYNDGTAISNIKDNNLWKSDTLGAWCYYQNDSTLNTIYGKLYNVYTLKYNDKSVCPTGWHVPTLNEWTILSDYLGGNSVSGGKLKEKSDTYWKNVSSNVTLNTNTFFDVLPGGSRNTNFDVDFSGLNNGARFLSNNYQKGYTGIILFLIESTSMLTSVFNYSGSIRCVKD